jgi:hypothetical protein
MRSLPRLGVRGDAPADRSSPEAGRHLSSRRVATGGVGRAGFTCAQNVSGFVHSTVQLYVQGAVHSCVHEPVQACVHVVVHHRVHAKVQFAVQISVHAPVHQIVHSPVHSKVHQLVQGPVQVSVHTTQVPHSGTSQLQGIAGVKRRATSDGGTSELVRAPSRPSPSVAGTRKYFASVR